MCVVLWFVCGLAVVLRWSLQAFEAATHTAKHEYGPLLIYLSTSKSATNKELRGVLRLFVQLRTADTKVQLPVAKAIIAWCARLPMSILRHK